MAREMAETATQNASYNDAQQAAADQRSNRRAIATQGSHPPEGAKVPERVLERVCTGSVEGSSYMRLASIADNLMAEQ